MQDTSQRRQERNRSNRTFMELKFAKAILSVFVNKSSNRTFMELKLAIAQRNAICKVVF